MSIASRERHKLIPASYLFLTKGDEILLLRRRNTGYHDGDYSFVSGHVDAGEAPRQAAVREAKEEAGITIKPEDLEIAHISVHKSDTDDSERVEFFWRCSVWVGEIENREPEKCDEIAWYNIDRLPPNLVPELADMLKHTKAGQIYSEFGYERN